jgi:hypothetical protein
MNLCAKHGRRVCVWCVVTTLSFPVEHAVWEKMPLFRTVTVALGL